MSSFAQVRRQNLCKNNGLLGLMPGIGAFMAPQNTVRVHLLICANEQMHK